jgi:N-acyl-L-homoserine lactone synthetase
MIEIYTGRQVDADPALAKEIYTFRYEVAVEEMGWDLPNTSNGMDKDEFDLPSTIHIIDRKKTGGILGVSRLNMMSGPNLMRDIFPDYCAPDRLPKADDALEHSRFLAKRKSLSTTEYMHVLGRLLLAVHEYGLYIGASKIVSLTYMTHYNLAVRLFRARPLGFPKVYPEDGNMYLAFSCKVSEAGIINTQRYTGISDAQLNLRDILELSANSKSKVVAA